jgi:hypothetical protein
LCKIVKNYQPYDLEKSQNSFSKNEKKNFLGSS